MSPLVTLILYGWVPITVFLFVLFPPPRAFIISMVVATLFLPQGALKLPVLGEYTKVTAACFGCLIATVIFQPNRLTSFKPGWLDLPMIVWCLSMIPSQVTNGLSPISPTIGQFISWGLPYFLGRIYLSDLAGGRLVAMGILYGGLAYAPLCLYESRFSPILHVRFYGFSPRTDFLQSMRLGGYRPSVFMEHGLAVGMWMMAVALMALWLWQTKTIKKAWNMPAAQAAGLLVLTLIMCRSTGAYVYCVLGVIILFVALKFRTSILLILLIFGVSAYIQMCATGSFYSTPYVMNKLNNSTELNDRGQSVAFRMANEKILSEKARQRVLFGWGGSGGNHVANEMGETITITDSLWIIAFGVNGTLGLVSFVAIFLLPPFAFTLMRYPAKTWTNPKVAPSAGIAVILALYMLDSSLNAFPNPVFVVAAGSLSGMTLKPAESLKAKTKARAIVPQTQTRSRPLRSRALNYRR